jgi:hypothetical protein
MTYRLAIADLRSVFPYSGKLAIGPLIARFCEFSLEGSFLPRRGGRLRAVRPLILVLSQQFHFYVR